VRDRLLAFRPVNASSSASDEGRRSSMMRSSLRFGSDSTFASDSIEVNQIFGSSGRRRRSPFHRGSR
jgi:hypothetical protein